MLDTKTLVMVLFMLTVLSPVLFFLLHKFLGQVGGTLQWLYAALLTALGLCLIMLQDIAPEFVTVVVAYTAFALSWGMAWTGMRIFVDRPALFPTMWAIVACLFFSQIIFTYGYPSQVWRSTSEALVIGLFCCLIAHDLFMGALAQGRPMRIYGMVIYALNALTMAVRIVLLHMVPLDGRYFQSGPLNQALFMWSILLSVSLTACLVLMVSEKLQAEVKTLWGIVPICANCKKIRDDKGYWQQVEQYVQAHTQAQFSHGICPECVEKLYPEVAARRKAGGNT